MVPFCAGRVNVGGVCLLLLAALVARAGEPEPAFHLSPPSRSPSGRAPGEIRTDLRGLRDARGLALLVEDDAAAERILRVMRRWERVYRPLLRTDPVLKKIDARTRALFAALLADRSRPSSEFARIVSRFDQKKLRPRLLPWLRSLFLRKGVAFRSDLGGLGRAELEDICLQARSMHTLKGLSSWRYRLLAWRYRDTEVRDLFAERDERLRFLTPVGIDTRKLDPATGRAVRRYLAMVRNLQLQVIKDRTMPYDRFRTLDGLLRGLRYMDTIRRACRVTGLDHRMMTRLFIQESEFIHHRVSWAGAFSVAQFLNIALKDIWLFRGRIPGARELLEGIGSYEELRSRVIDDPRMAIEASCVYFRRLYDEVILRLGDAGRRASQEVVNLLTVEMFVLRRGMLEQASQDSMIQLARHWPVKEITVVPVAPLAGGAVPATRVLLTDWVERTVRNLARVRITEGLFRERRDLLFSALGLAAYNAGMGNLVKEGKRRSVFKSLSFPLQITENRNYVDDILDGKDILDQIDDLAADVSLLGYDSLMDLAEEACRMVRDKKSGKLSGQK